MTQETGRSMVEMLGVLALIGILSVAGIAGYKLAMNKYRANTLMEEVTKRAVVVAGKISLNGLKAPVTPSAELIDEFTNPKGYEFLVSKKNDNQFNILIDTVDEAVCSQVKSIIGIDSPIQEISDDCTELTFNNDLSEEEVLGGSSDDSETESSLKKDNEECQTDSECESGVCVSGVCGLCSGDESCGDCQRCDADTHHCVAECEASLCTYDYTGASSKKICCTSEKGTVLGEFCCASTGGTEENPECCSDAQGQNCCPVDTPLVNSSGTCYSCSHSNYIVVDGVSYRCESVCPGKRLIYEGYSSLCFLCPQSGELRGPSGGALTKTQCDKCDNLKWDDKAKNGSGVCTYKAECTADKPLSDRFGQCHSCSQSNYFDVDGVEYRCESVCSGKRYLFNSICYRCPQKGSGTSVSSYSQERCSACSDTLVWNATTSQCEYK